MLHRFHLPKQKKWERKKTVIQTGWPVKNYLQVEMLPRTTTFSQEKDARSHKESRPDPSTVPLPGGVFKA